MSSYWKLLDECFSEHISMFENSSFHFKNGIKIMNSGTMSHANNLMMLNSINFNQDVDFIKNKLSFPAIIFSETYNVAPDLLGIFYDRIRYLGEYPVMERRESQDYYSAPYYDNMTIENNHYNPIITKDFIKLYLKANNIHNDCFNVPDKDNIHIFVCYISNKPVGYLYAISQGSDAFVVEAYIKESYRNSGILGALAKHGKEYVVSHGIYNFYSIATSEHTVMTVKEEGHRMIGSVHAWAVSE